MGVITVRTGGEDIGYIDWEIEVPWKLRREIHRQKAIEMYAAGGTWMFQLDTDKLLSILWPEAIVGWDRDEALTEESFWSTPIIHLDRLAGQVAEFLVSGKEPGTAKPHELDEMAVEEVWRWLGYRHGKDVAGHGHLTG